MENLIIRTAADLRALRKEKGVTVPALAEKIGVSRRMLTQWESGNINLTLYTIEKICHALDSFAELNFYDNNCNNTKKKH